MGHERVSLVDFNVRKSLISRNWCILPLLPDKRNPRSTTCLKMVKQLTIVWFILTVPEPLSVTIFLLRNNQCGKLEQNPASGLSMRLWAQLMSFLMHKTVCTAELQEVTINRIVCLLINAVHIYCKIR